MVFRNISVSSPVEIVVHALFFDMKEEKGKESGQKTGKGSKEQSKFSDVRLSHKNINGHNLVLY